MKCDKNWWIFGLLLELKERSKRYELLVVK